MSPSFSYLKAGVNGGRQPTKKQMSILQNPSGIGYSRLNGFYLPGLRKEAAASFPRRFKLRRLSRKDKKAFKMVGG